MNITKIKDTSGIEILDSNYVLSFSKTDPIILEINEKDGTPIKVRFEFIQDDCLSENKIKLNMYDKDTLQVLIKYKSPLGNFGLVEPINIGSFNGRKLFFNFRLTMNNLKDNPIINYTWYLGKEEVL